MSVAPLTSWLPVVVGMTAASVRASARGVTGGVEACPDLALTVSLATSAACWAPSPKWMTYLPASEGVNEWHVKFGKTGG